METHVAEHNTINLSPAMLGNAAMISTIDTLLQAAQVIVNTTLSAKYSVSI